MNRDEALQKLEGYETRVSIDKKEGGRIKTILLPFTPVDWCMLCMHGEDDYLGGCCPALSHVQDIMSGVFRDGGWMAANDIQSVCMALDAHDGVGGAPWNFSKPPEAYPTLEEFKALRTWDRMTVLWHLVKDHLVAERPKLGYKRSNNESPTEMKEFDHALKAALSGFHYLDVHRLFNSLGRGSDDKFDPAVEMQKKASLGLALFRFLPAFKMVMDRIHHLDPGVLEGFAIVDDADDVVINGRGHCIYPDKTSAEQDRDLAIEFNASYKDILRVKPVRVSVEKGLEFT